MAALQTKQMEHVGTKLQCNINKKKPEPELIFGMLKLLERAKFLLRQNICSFNFLPKCKPTLVLCDFCGRAVWLALSRRTPTKSEANCFSSPTYDVILPVNCEKSDSDFWFQTDSTNPLVLNWSPFFATRVNKSEEFGLNVLWFFEKVVTVICKICVYKWVFVEIKLKFLKNHENLNFGIFIVFTYNCTGESKSTLKIYHLITFPLYT
jgi:hypothetical protein